jgi:hypothetical protein
MNSFEIEETKEELTLLLRRYEELTKERDMVLRACDRLAKNLNYEQLKYPRQGRIYKKLKEIYDTKRANSRTIK